MLAGEAAGVDEGTRAIAGSLLLNKRSTSLCAGRSGVRVGSRSFVLFTEGWLQAQAAQSDRLEPPTSSASSHNSQLQDTMSSLLSDNSLYPPCCDQYLLRPQVLRSTALEVALHVR